MVPGNTTSTAATAAHSSWQWNSPLPYLFGSLGIMISLITVALVILACSMHKRSANTSPDVEEKQAKAENASVNIMVPQILVIMAGDENPTHLAVPVASLPNYPDHHV